VVGLRVFARQIHNLLGLDNHNRRRRIGWRNLGLEIGLASCLFDACFSTFAASAFSLAGSFRPENARHRLTAEDANALAEIGPSACASCLVMNRRVIRKGHSLHFLLEVKGVANE
jgi:hypothetical protein